jgi:hypothetical protein
LQLTGDYFAPTPAITAEVATPAGLTQHSDGQQSAPGAQQLAFAVDLATVLPTPKQHAEMQQSAPGTQQSAFFAMTFAAPFAASAQHSPVTQQASPASQHAAFGPQQPGPPTAQQSAFFAATFDVPAQHEALSVAFVDTAACTPAEQQRSQVSQQLRQSVSHAGHALMQQTGLSEAPGTQHPPSWATGQSAFERFEQQCEPEDRK